MRLKLPILLLLFFVSQVAFSQSTLLNPDLVSKMSISEKIEVYKDNKKDPTLPTVLNILLGNGVGSFTMNDSVGGVIGLSADVLSGIFILSALSAANYSLGYLSRQSALLPLSIGSLLFVGSKLFQILRPFSISQAFNKQLSDELSLFNKIGLTVSPEEVNFLLNLRF